MLLHYKRSSWWIFNRRGSLFPCAFLVALPAGLISLSLKLLYLETEDDFYAMKLLSSEGGTAAWSGFNFLVGFVIVFRTSQAYGRFWDAMSDTEKMMAEWFDAASSIAAFTRASEQNMAVEVFLHTIIRLFSLLSASALQDLSQVKLHDTWGLPVLDPSVVDKFTILTLEGTKDTRVELVYSWIQQLVTANINTGVLSVPPPILARAYSELSTGMAKFQDARKHAKIPFPFPYAQTTTWILIFHWALTPLIMVTWSDWPIGTFVFTFIQVFLLWALNFMAVGFEQPFGGELNDLDPDYMQKRMNKQLICLMDPSARKLPYLPQPNLVDFLTLKKTANMTQAALIREGWELKSLADGEDTEDAKASGCCFSACCSCCCPRRDTKKARMNQKVAVSRRYCEKRYAIVDGERTAALTVAIFSDELVLAVPLASGLAAGKPAQVFELQNVKGNLCQLRMKKVPIVERHGLVKEPPPEWEMDFLDFPKGYSFRQEDLVALYHANAGKISGGRSRVERFNRQKTVGARDEEAGTIEGQLAATGKSASPAQEPAGLPDVRRTVSSSRARLSVAEASPGSQDSGLSAAPHLLDLSPGPGQQMVPSPRPQASGKHLRAGSPLVAVEEPPLLASESSPTLILQRHVSQDPGPGQTPPRVALPEPAAQGLDGHQVPANEARGRAGFDHSDGGGLVAAEPTLRPVNTDWGGATEAELLASCVSDHGGADPRFAFSGELARASEAESVLAFQFAPAQGHPRDDEASLVYAGTLKQGLGFSGTADLGTSGDDAGKAMAPAASLPGSFLDGGAATMEASTRLADTAGDAADRSGIGVQSLAMPACPPAVDGPEPPSHEAAFGFLPPAAKDAVGDAVASEATPELEPLAGDDIGGLPEGEGLDGGPDPPASAFTTYGKFEEHPQAIPELEEIHRFDSPDFRVESPSSRPTTRQSRGGQMLPWGGAPVEDSDSEAGGDVVPWGGGQLVTCVSTDSLAASITPRQRQHSAHLQLMVQQQQQQQPQAQVQPLQQAQPLQYLPQPLQPVQSLQSQQQAAALQQLSQQPSLVEPPIAAAPSFLSQPVVPSRRPSDYSEPPLPGMVPEARTEQAQSEVAQSEQVAALTASAAIAARAAADAAMAATAALAALGAAAPTPPPQGAASAAASEALGTTTPLPSEPPDPDDCDYLGAEVIEEMDSVLFANGP